MKKRDDDEKNNVGDVDNLSGASGSLSTADIFNSGVIRYLLWTSCIRNT